MLNVEHTYVHLSTRSYLRTQGTDTIFPPQPHIIIHVFQSASIMQII